MGQVRVIAASCGSKVISFQHDIRWAFYQLYLALSERWVSGFYLLLELDGELWFCDIEEFVVNMGTRPASNVQSRFSEKLLAVWREAMDDFVNTVWLPKQSAAVKEFINERVQEHGEAGGRPYFAAVFTDDFTFTFADLELAIFGAKNARPLGRQQFACIDVPWVVAWCSWKPGYITVNKPIVELLQ